MRAVILCFAVGLACTIGSIAVAAQVSEIPNDWQPKALQQLQIVSATASSNLGPNFGSYGPANVIDGNRGTKWVASVPPSKTEPQWISLKTGGPRRVSAVAVHGEALDNDGILACEVQVENVSGGFTTVAKVDPATSRSWAATFEPVVTTGVRLSITRSNNSSPHTDVYEVQVFGKKLSSDEKKALGIEWLRSVRQSLQKSLLAVDASLEKIGNRLPAILQPYKRRALDLHARSKQIDESLAKWDNLSEQESSGLFDKTQAADLEAQSLANQLEQVVNVWPVRVQELGAAGEMIVKHQSEGRIIAERENNKLWLVGKGVALMLNEKTGLWDISWAAPCPAAVYRCGFSIEAGGKTLVPADVKAEVEPFEDKLGSGLVIHQRWGDTLRVERSLKLYKNRSVAVVTAKVTNTTNVDIALQNACLVEVDRNKQGWWYAGAVDRAPAAVSLQGSATLVCQPASSVTGINPQGANFSATAVLGFAPPSKKMGFVLGYLSGLEACPNLSAGFDPGSGGLGLASSQSFHGRKLRPGETLELDAVYLAAESCPYAVLEHFGDAVAAWSSKPIRKGQNALWCSWYAHRMHMSEDLVLANAAVIAKYFKSLGMEIVQLDHGWQRGDVTGDWTANERFPHGLKWLSDELRTRHGLKLGAWIAPTVVADTTETFKKHADWLLRDDKGKPKYYWKWYWEPKPACYLIDASNPGGAKFLEDTFARLSAAGVCYYKIDFISGCGSEGFSQYDPYCTRGWGVLRRAMEAIRRGAGENAWIRYCQCPPHLSTGVADSAYGGADTSDSGVASVINVLRPNARSLAAGYWINNRLYSREVCDMSVGMSGPVWEARMKMAMMGLAGCSVSFSDELQYQPPSRIRMMQRCLPPGAPTMRPLDLFDRDIPSQWHVHCKNDADEWEVLGLFNFNDTPQKQTVTFADMGLSNNADVTVFSFWDEQFLGVHRDRLELELRPRESRILFIRKLRGHPQLVGTNMHLLGGYHELKSMKWDDAKSTLSARFSRMPGIEGRSFFYLPAGYKPRIDFPLSENSARLTQLEAQLWMREIVFDRAEYDCSMQFVVDPALKQKAAPAPEPVTPSEATTGKDK
ncbi:MAG: discoidin domain-containing protein [Pirellulales bacterium]|nr:discoidin domain-containing protein [Pirellulales bacterium]